MTYNTVALLLCAVLFYFLQRWFALNKRQTAWRQDIWTDVIYWLFPPLLYAKLGKLFLLTVLLVVTGSIDAGVTNAFIERRTAWSEWPLGVQFILLLLIMDFVQYWIHRLYHGRKLWRFHAIHHSAKQVDWLTCVRFHPLNIIFYSTLVTSLSYLLGFSPQVFAVLVPFNLLYSPMVHANLNWTFGPLRYLFASPVFHRWHHTLRGEGGNKNFAPTFPFYDVIFGTFYMPKGEMPEHYGTDDDVPQDFVGQMVYPFTRK